MEELKNKLNSALESRYPDSLERNEVVATMGQIIISESLLEIIEAITDENIRKKFVDAINAENTALAGNIAEAAGVDILGITTDKSAEVLSSVLG